MINRQDEVIRNFDNLVVLEFAARLTKQEGWLATTN